MTTQDKSKCWVCKLVTARGISNLNRLAMHVVEFSKNKTTMPDCPIYKLCPQCPGTECEKCSGIGIIGRAKEG